MSNPDINEVYPGIFIGNLAASLCLKTLKKHNITGVLSIRRDKKSYWSTDEYRRVIRPDRHIHISIDDTEYNDIISHFHATTRFIEMMRITKRVKVEHTTNNDPFPVSITMIPPGNLLVHCTVGKSRSVSAVIAWQMFKTNRSPEPILEEIRTKRPIAEPNEGFMRQLRLWKEWGYDIYEDPVKTKGKKAYLELFRELAVHRWIEHRKWEERTWGRKQTKEEGKVTNDAKVKEEEKDDEGKREGESES